MKYVCFLKDVDFSAWVMMKGLNRWHIATYKESYVLLLYHKNCPYGIAIEHDNRLQGHGYNIITDVQGLPPSQYEIIPENNTGSRLLNADEYNEIGLHVARTFYATLGL